jgi:hypothetical protein
MTLRTHLMQTHGFRVGLKAAQSAAFLDAEL